MAHAQLAILHGLQQQLEDATPGAADLVAAALEQERALQAARDAQVLQLLRAKVRGWAEGQLCCCGTQMRDVFSLGPLDGTPSPKFHVIRPAHRMM